MVFWRGAVKHVCYNLVSLWNDRILLCSYASQALSITKKAPILEWEKNADGSLKDCLLYTSDAADDM
eukprot:4114121-Karenia_brevis.AAC.1